ncbi:DUF3320 domain-containing protein [Asticcacaulis sp.]|jgi:very-short-patch-repair endonuclease|uniref:DUF3320 domain-containing protein n=1 Tax=Asticcacaulis sp. TaxID=1872648 RepID=UPI003F7B3600
MADGDSIISIRERLLKERHALLDLSTRNRLLNVPLRTRNNRAVEIVDERAAEVFRTLSDGKNMTFLAGAQLSAEERADLDEDDIETGGIPQPDDDDLDANGKAARHTDTKLQTRLTSEGLQKRLFDVWYDAQTLEQEQGVNILYLALGLLRWRDADNSDLVRHAPLVLLPVKLERFSAADIFKLKWRDEPPSPNLTLQAKMKVEFGLVIEDFKDEDSLDLPAYFRRIAETVSSKANWDVLPDAMVLGFFSFSKFLMYRDLDPENWPEDAMLAENPLVSALLRDGFAQTDPIIPESLSIDDAIPAQDLHHVVDADSSQTVAIAEAAGGRTLVIKGPPGTGKSQTITNIIAAAAARGRKVLFVSEKMAALDVVHRRLKQVGLGPLTLELHSNKINKRAVLEELKRTRDSGLKTSREDPGVVDRLAEATGGLNAFVHRLHAPLQPSGLTPQNLLGRLSAWERDGRPGEDYELEGAQAWSKDDVAKRVALAREIAERLTPLGPIGQNPWRGVQADAFDPAERDRLMKDIAAVQQALERCLTAAATAQTRLVGPDPTRLSDLDEALAYLEVSTAPASVDRSALGHTDWSDLARIRELLDTGIRLNTLRTSARGLFNETGLTADYTAIRQDVVVKSASLFRFLDGQYRANVAHLRSYLTSPLPKDASERLKLIDLAISLQNAERDFQARAPIGRVFGQVWKGDNSDWTRLEEILTWRQANIAPPQATWAAFSRLSQSEVAEVETARNDLSATLAAFKTLLDHILKTLKLGLKHSPGDVSLQPLNIRFTNWLGNVEGLSQYIAFASRGRQLVDLGAGAIVQAIHKGELMGPQIEAALVGAYLNVMRNELFASWPALKAFDGEAHNQQVDEFRRLDRLRIELAKEQIAVQHNEGRPRGASGIGPLGVLNGEIAKKRSHLPIRQLLDKAGPAIQQLKPVFMMSPLSVAQFLKPGGLQFDLLVMDEASQIEPVDALGAIARVKQLVVVGDERQLPPTSFFKKLTGEEEPEDDDVPIQAKDAESILDLCLAKGAPHRMLSWHYRSKHQSLIAVSNREFYDNRLLIVPSPFDAVAGMGLKLHYLPESIYERGGSRTNPVEARRVAEAVMAHAENTPDQSLGVATFSVVQRQAILKELELLRRARPACEGFFSGGGSEPFFVKNLENIQGDERDVILISVGYGKGKDGKLAHAFGPLSGEGGERRLNVLISRAKSRCEVFCNFKGADIDLEKTPSRGVAALKLFLTFAETGRFAPDNAATEDAQTHFEQQVRDRLLELGYNVKTHIGASGFQIDLAVSDPNQPGRFLLGVECDGAQYRSSRSARDRDRLRQQVLEAHGWIIHRIWSADWYLRPKVELQKLETAIRAAQDEWRERDEEVLIEKDMPAPVADTYDDEVHAEAEIESDDVGLDDGAGRSDYVEAWFAVNQAVEPHFTSRDIMATYVAKIVDVEGPIHVDEVVTRIRNLWGLQRAGNRIRATVINAIRLCLARNVMVQDEEFLSTSAETPVGVRDRSRVKSYSLRRIEMLPPAEIQAGLIETVRGNFGANRIELATAVSRQLGFASTSGQLRSLIDEQMDRLIARGELADRNGLIVLGNL